MKNRIYFFSGTGNSLKVAEKIGNELSDCELVAIGKDTASEIPSGYERIGFVFPSYAGGPPALVAEFIRNMAMPTEGTPYLFAVATYGGNARDIQALVAHMFSERGIPLDYSAKVMSYPNALPSYRLLVRFMTRRGESGTRAVTADISGMKRTTAPAPKESAQQYYHDYMASIHDSDKKYRVNENCVVCGICEKLCPAKNITMENKKPSFHHSCESCLACLAFCPQSAINTGDKGQKGKRYTYPNIKPAEIIGHYTNR